MIEVRIRWEALYRHDELPGVRSVLGWTRPSRKRHQQSRVFVEEVSNATMQRRPCFQRLKW